MGNVVASSPSPSGTAATQETATQYVLGGPVTHPDDAEHRSLFVLHSASKPGTTDKFSAFVFQRSQPSGSIALPVVQNALQKASKYAELIASGNPQYDGLLKIFEVKQNTNSVEIFAEPVKPLAASIEDMTDDEVKAGLFSVGVREFEVITRQRRTADPWPPPNRHQRTLQLLHSQNIAHCNLSVHTIYVSTRNRVWKLALDFASSLSSEEWSVLHSTQSWQYPNACPPEFVQKAKIMPNYPLWARDSYAFAVLLEEAGAVLTGSPRLKELLVRMRAPDPLVRPDFKEILATDYFSNSSIVKGMNLCFDIRESKLTPALAKPKFLSLIAVLKSTSEELIGRIFVPLILRTNVVTDPAFKESGLDSLLFSPKLSNKDVSGLLPLEYYSKGVLPFVEWGWRLTSHPSRDALRMLLCKNATKYVKYLDSTFVRTTLQKELAACIFSTVDDVCVFGMIAAPALAQLMGTRPSIELATFVEDILALASLGPRPDAPKQHITSTGQPRSERVRKMAIAAAVNVISQDGPWPESLVYQIARLGVADPGPSVRRMVAYKLSLMLADQSQMSRRLTATAIVSTILTPMTSLVADADATVRDRARRSIKKILTVLEKREVNKTSAGGATSPLAKKPGGALPRAATDSKLASSPSKTSTRPQLPKSSAPKPKVAAEIAEVKAESWDSWDEGWAYKQPKEEVSPTKTGEAHKETPATFRSGGELDGILNDRLATAKSTKAQEEEEEDIDFSDMKPKMKAASKVLVSTLSPSRSSGSLSTASLSPSTSLPSLASPTQLPITPTRLVSADIGEFEEGGDGWGESDSGWDKTDETPAEHSPTPTPASDITPITSNTVDTTVREEITASQTEAVATTAVTVEPEGWDDEAPETPKAEIESAKTTTALEAPSQTMETSINTDKASAEHPFTEDFDYWGEEPERDLQVDENNAQMDNNPFPPTPEPNPPPSSTSDKPAVEAATLTSASLSAEKSAERTGDTPKKDKPVVVSTSFDDEGGWGDEDGW